MEHQHHRPQSRNALIAAATLSTLGIVVATTAAESAAETFSSPLFAISLAGVATAARLAKDRRR